MVELSDKIGLGVRKTNKIGELSKCGHLLCYLTGQTWTGGKLSEAFAEEVQLAMKLGVHVLLAHEMPGLFGQSARHGAEFGTFFAVRATTAAALIK